MNLGLLFQGDPVGAGEVIKAVAAIGLAPTLLILALYFYKQRTDQTIEHLEKIIEELMRKLP